MTCWPIMLADGAGHQWPTPRASRASVNPSTIRASSPRVEQGGSGDRQLQNGLCRSSGMLSVGCVAGLAVPPYGLPSTDPAPLGFPGLRCLRQLDGDRSGRLRLWRASPPLLTDRGRLAPATHPARREFPLDPLPSRGTADRRRSPRARPEPGGPLLWRRT